MNEPNVSERDLSSASTEEMNSALFAHLVMQQSNMALMFMGKAAHPQTGETVHDIEGAKLFIDQLEMLEAKTKGNLSKEESALLKQTLMALRLSFVEAVESPHPQSQAEPAATPGEPSPAGEPVKTTPDISGPAEEVEHRTKFTKKY